MCCKCLQLRSKIRTYQDANSCSHYLTLHPHCLPELLQPEHRLWFAQRLSSLSQDSNSPVLVSQTSQTAMPLSPSMIAQSEYILNREGKSPFLSTPCCSHQYKGRRRTADSLHWSITDSAIALQTFTCREEASKGACKAVGCHSHWHKSDPYPDFPQKVVVYNASREPVIVSAVTACWNRMSVVYAPSLSDPGGL